MKLSYAWLQQYIAIDQSVETLCHQLTQAGLEVEGISPVAPEFNGVVVGQVQSIKPHPNADKLQLCDVDIGQSESLSIVCGAPNVVEGGKFPVATIGATLPNDFKIKPAKLRGVASQGMLCSSDELGLPGDHDGLMPLANDAPVGQDIRTYLQLDDSVIEIDLTPNRGDCLSVYGVAREIGALNDTLVAPLHQASISENGACDKTVTIQASDACPHYAGRLLTNIDPSQPTPEWMVQRLQRSGIEPIALLVDITNYVMLLTGQPLHAFDADKLTDELFVRYAHSDESLTLLNGNQVTCDSQTLVIADQKAPVALAGIMGGQNSAVSDQTQHVFVESAYFKPEAIAGKARQYGLHTDSSHRFERGVDPALQKTALEMACQLIQQLAGGQASPMVATNAAKVPENPVITLSCQQVNRLLGTDLSGQAIHDYLTRLSMSVQWQVGDDCMQVQAPSYRFDISIAQDLIEEVARLYGYANLPMENPQLTLSQPDVTEHEQSTNRITDLFVDRGYYEVINFSFIDPALGQTFAHQQPIVLKNPIASEMAMMRQSLIPGLVQSFKHNTRRQQETIRLFEQGQCFFQTQQHAYTHQHKIALLASGLKQAGNWRDAKQAVDFFDVKGDVEALLAMTGQSYQWRRCQTVTWLHPGQSAYLDIDGKCVGVLGRLHPDVMSALQIKSSAPIVFEADLAALQAHILPIYQPVSKYPQVTRDFALLVPEDVAVGQLLQTIEQLNIAVVQKVEVFDIYQGDSVDQGYQSVAIKVTLQDPDKTLSEAQLTDVTHQIVTTLTQQHGVTLRV